MEHVPRRSSPFLAVPRFRSAPDPPACPSRVNHPLRLCLTLCRLSSFFLAPTFLRILPRRPYRKCIYVLCKAGNRRWPREPDARRVINTDALVLRSLSLSLSLSLSSFLILFISFSFHFAPNSSFRIFPHNWFRR